MVKRHINIIILLTVLSLISTEYPLNFNIENTGNNCSISQLPEPENLQSIQTLPNPFIFSSTNKEVKSLEDWKCRRAEIKAQLEKYEIGLKPETAIVKSSLLDNILIVEIFDNNQTLTLNSSITIPNTEGPHPIIIGMNSATGSLNSEYFSDFIQVPFFHDQVAIYSMTGIKNTNIGFYKLYPNLINNGDYSAWAWGVSRLIDGIGQISNKINADMSKIVVTGCSYAGKMALFSGAFDERVTLTIAQESGGGGINAWRVAEILGNVEKIENTNYSWFMQYLKNNFNKKVDLLPYDHHELIGMIAPRAFLALGNPDYEWLGDESGYVSVLGAYEIWKAMGINERFGFDFSAGHMHCVASMTQNQAVNEYVNKFIRGKSGKQIMNSNFKDVDVDKWIGNWGNYIISEN